MSKPRKPNQKDVIELLEALRETPLQDSSTLESNRAAYLEQVNSLPQPVSPRRFLRLNWHSNTGKLRLRTLTIAVVLFFAILGSGVITVSAAQTSLPGEQLYPVKIWFEDFRLALAFDSFRKLELHLEFAAERLAELSELVDQGSTHIPSQISEDFDRHIQEAGLLLSAQDDDRGYARIYEDLISQYEKLKRREEDQEDPEEDSDEDTSGSSEDENEDKDDDSEVDDDKKDSDEEESEGQPGSTSGEDDDDTLEDSDEEGRQATREPEETEDPEDDPDDDLDEEPDEEPDDPDEKD
jgi:hypothetical protein